MLDLGEEWSEYHAHGDAETRARLIVHGVPLVRYVVGKVAPGLPATLDREDLFETGILGLIDAIERYDPDHDAKFESYAILRIKGAVLDELRANDFNPRTVRRRIRRAEEIRRRLRERYRGTPAEPHLDEALEADDWEQDDASGVHLVSFVSLYDRAPEGRRDGSRVIDVLPDGSAPDALEQARGAEVKQALDQAVEELPRYERLIVTLYYYQGMMLKDIGRLFRVTESRISQVHSRALRHLRSKLRVYA